MNTFLLALALPYFAVAADAPAPAVYDCQVILAAADVASGAADWSFVSNTGGTHGGDPKVFTTGNHAVSVTVDQQWLGVNWDRAGKTVASAEFVVGQGDAPLNKVGILYDPSHPGDQVSIGCQKRN